MLLMIPPSALPLAPLSCSFFVATLRAFSSFFFFFFNDPAPTEIYTLSLHDALPILEPDAEIEDLAAALSRPPISATVNLAVSPHTPSVTRSVVTPTPQGKEHSRRDRTVLYAVIVLAMLISGGAIWGWLRPAPAKQVVRSMLAIDSTEALAPSTAWSGRLAISPDGSRLAYIGGPRSPLLIPAPNQLHALAVPGAERATSPVFLP